MLSEKMNQALSEQMCKEFHAHYSYLAAAAYFEEEELPGFANFFRIQADEEHGHAMRLFDYIHRAGGSVQFYPIDAPKRTFTTPLEVFEHGLASERKLAADINAIMELAYEERHPPTKVFIEWFITEQLEEEDLFSHWIRRIQRVGQEGQGLLFLDRELAARRPEAEGH